MYAVKDLVKQGFNTLNSYFYSVFFVIKFAEV